MFWRAAEADLGQAVVDAGAVRTAAGGRTPSARSRPADRGRATARSGRTGAVGSESAASRHSSASDFANSAASTSCAIRRHVAAALQARSRRDGDAGSQAGVRRQDRRLAQQHDGDAAVAGQGRIVRIERLGAGLAGHLIDAVGVDAGALQDPARGVGARPTTASSRRRPCAAGRRWRWCGRRW